MTRLCEQYLETGKSLKCMQSRKESGTIPKPKEQNYEIALDLARSFQYANNLPSAQSQE